MSDSVPDAFRRIGSSLTRRVIFYLSAEDAYSFTAGCRWLAYLRHHQPDLAQAIGDPAAPAEGGALLLALRVRDIKRSAGLKIDAVFEPQFASVFHAEVVGSALVFLSTYKGRVVVWELCCGAPRVRLSLPALSEVVSHSVCDSAIAVASRTALTLNVLNWKDRMTHQRADYEHVFPAPALPIVQLLWPCRRVVVAVGETLTVFSAELQKLCQVTLAVPGLSRLVAPNSGLLVPCSSRPYVLRLYPVRYALFDVVEGRLLVSKALHFSSILQWDTLVLAGSEKEKWYLVILGLCSHGLALFANGTLQSKEVTQFAVHGNRVVGHTNSRKLLVYEANLDGLVLLRTMNMPGGVFDHFFPFADAVITVKSESQKSSIHVCDGRTCTIKYIYKKAILHTERLATIDATSYFAFRGYLVVAGSYREDRCVAVVSYFQNRADKDLAALHREYQERGKAYYRAKADEEAKTEKLQRERIERKREMEQAAARFQKRKSFMKARSLKARKLDLWLDLLDQLDDFRLFKVPNNRQSASRVTEPMSSLRL